MDKELHVHFDGLIAPFADRLSKVEALTQHMEGDIKILSAEIKDLKVVLQQHTIEETKLLAEINQNIAANRTEVSSIKSWIIGIGTGLTIVIGLLTVLNQLGVLK